MERVPTAKENTMVRTVIFGSGFMAKKHALNLVHSGRALVVGVCGSSLQKSRKFIKDLNLISANSYENFHQMIDVEKPTAAYFTVPPFAHSGEVEYAASKGVHLFLEKPIAFDVKRAEQMAESIRTNDVVSQVGYHMRFRKTMVRLRELVNQGATGRPTLFQGRFFTRFDGPAWWRDSKRGGGQLFEQAIHLYDLATHFFGPVSRVSGALANLTHLGREDYSIEDTGVSVLWFENGALGTIANSNSTVERHFNGDFRAVFENVTVDYRSTGDFASKESGVIYFANGNQEEIVEDGNPHFEETLDFLKGIQEGQRPLCSPNQGVEGVRLVRAIENSSLQGGMPINV